MLERTLVLLFLRYPFEQWVVQAVASVTIAHFNSVGNAAGRKLVDGVIVTALKHWMAKSGSGGGPGIYAHLIKYATQRVYVQRKLLWNRGGNAVYKL